ncbi:RHS repeat-associated core domain-containing protein [Pseudomonas reinekei]|jgi:RHS repeat-associated protein|uniref:RHS repeat-associated core domain-containing protein n=1 Tax=Pseudomonas reinekei TaxID=395598 RepID=A0A1H0QH25_PSERE|nr:RHS repeat-associated core domain-containing protein [Pseudomonas reinekei]SDP16584.1 RHS repeat-associated core domain-containing protein [Pseudomonas reinekei]
MPLGRETLLCHYHYDPQDRLVDCTPAAQATTRRFYLKDRLATEIQGVVQRSIMQHDDHLLAQQQRQSGVVETHLLASDQQRSVLNVLDAARLTPLAYSPYGHHPAESGLLSLFGFNGERPDPVTGCYLLGNGYRAFNPVLMRFNSPDSWSPFGDGGLNAYAYCVGDPVNRTDPTGHKGNPFKAIFGFFKRTPRTRSTANRELLNPLAHPQTSATLYDAGQSSSSSLSRSSVSSQVSKTDSAPYGVSFHEELPPSYQNLYPNIELVEPDIGFRFEQALRRSKNDLDYLEMLLHNPEQAPALNAIKHDIGVVEGIINKLYALHDEATLPIYPTTPVNRHLRQA